MASEGKFSVVNLERVEMQEVGMEGTNDRVKMYVPAVHSSRRPSLLSLGGIFWLNCIIKPLYACCCSLRNESSP